MQDKDLNEIQREVILAVGSWRNCKRKNGTVAIKKRCSSDFMSDSIEYQVHKLFAIGYLRRFRSSRVGRTWFYDLTDMGRRAYDYIKETTKTPQGLM